MICIKVYTQGRERLVAACDTDIVGKTFRSDGLVLQLSESFYHGDEVDEDALVNWLRLATVANLSGERTVAVAVENGFVDEGGVVRIGGVPHAQMMRMI
ncbi:MAG: DUF424 domain-containing protein [Thermoplasmata archaeon]